MGPNTIQKMMTLARYFIPCILVCSACLKQQNDAPPDQTAYDPMLPVSHSINQLKALNGPFDATTGGDTTFIGQEVVIAGFVTANDRSGNFYKQLVIQDDSSAIMLLLDANNLYNDYPVGRKIYVKCRGLWLGYDGGLPVLGYTPNEQNGLGLIPQHRIADYLVKAAIGHPVRADTVDLAAVAKADNRYYNRLVCIREAEFADMMKTYAQPNSTTNRNLRDCGSGTMVLRTSNYASFASVPLPSARGSVTGIYTVFISGTKATPQLLIRDTSDVHFTQPRCGTVTGNILFRQDFSDQVAGDIALAGWTNFPQYGSQKWEYSNSGNVPSRPYAAISAFGTGDSSVVCWLITSAIDLNGKANPRLSFLSADGYDNGATLKVFISSNYNGSDPLSATWKQLPAVISSGHSSGYGSFITSGTIDLGAFVNNSVYIAFKYQGGDVSGTGDKTTTYELDDIIVAAD